MIVMAAKAANTFITACPAIMLPANLIEWLNGLTKYEIISIIARIGLRINGAEPIQNTFRKPNPCLINPKIVTNKKTPIARTAVTAMCEVVVNAIGSNPRKFEKTMNINSVMTKGKYFTPIEETF